MAKLLLRIKARKMRSKGESVRDIADKLKVSRSSASLWTRDIILSVEQMQKLRKKMIRGGALGRLKGSLKQKRQRLELIKTSRLKGIKEFQKFSKRELFISGLSLYWAEGTKKQRRISFCNSDPKLIMFMIKWLKEGFGIEVERLKAYVGINQIHKVREKKVRLYWSRTTGIPLMQFRKTSFKKVKNKKLYLNFNKHFGTLTVDVMKPAKIYYEVIGLIEGLKHQAG